MAKHHPAPAKPFQSRLESILDQCGIAEEQRLKILAALRVEKENLAAVALGDAPPQAPELEEALLGALISGNIAQSNGRSSILHAVRAYLPSPACFYLETNQAIYRALLEMDDARLQIDELTLVQFMRQNRSLDAVGGAAHIAELAKKATSTAHVETWSRFILEKYQAREIIRVCAGSIKNLYEHKAGIYEVAEALAKAGRLNNPHSLLHTAAMDDAIRAGALEKPKRRIIGALIREREVSILFSDEKTGKTILALQFAIAAATSTCLFDRPDLFPNECEPMRVQIFDFEMENRELYDRYSNPATGEAFQFGPNVIRSVFNPECFDLRAAPERMIAAVEAEIEKHRPRFVIIDNITWLVKESTDADIAAEFMTKMLQIQRRHELSVVVIAHTPKRNTAEPLQSKDLQGSKNLVNFCKNLIGVAASRKDKPIRYIKQIFCRNAQVFFDEQNVVECAIEKEAGNPLLKWTFLGLTKENEHLSAPEQQYSENELLQLISECRQKSMSYDKIRKHLNLPWHKTTIMRKFVDWQAGQSPSTTFNLDDAN